VIVSRECRVKSTPKDRTPKHLTPGGITPEDLTTEDLTLEDLTPEDLTPESLTLEDLTLEDLTPGGLTFEDLHVAPEGLPHEDLTLKDQSHEDLTLENVLISFSILTIDKTEGACVATQVCTRITDLNTLVPGDHIAWRRTYVVWHHAIVVETDIGENKLTVIHYSMAPDWSRTNNGQFTSIRVDVLTVNMASDWLYRFVYDVNQCFIVDEVLVRAHSREGEATYNFLANNCEHFARWCKTGHNVSFQSDLFLRHCRTIKEVLREPTRPLKASCLSVSKKVRTVLESGRQTVGPTVLSLVCMAVLSPNSWGD